MPQSRDHPKAPGACKNDPLKERVCCTHLVIKWPGHCQALLCDLGNVKKADLCGVFPRTRCQGKASRMPRRLSLFGSLSRQRPPPSPSLLPHFVMCCHPEDFYPLNNPITLSPASHHYSESTYLGRRGRINPSAVPGACHQAVWQARQRGREDRASQGDRAAMETAGDGRRTGLEPQLPWGTAQEGSRLTDFTRCLDQPCVSLSLK